MAKSSRSKWKKLHRRQRAQEVSAVVEKRVRRLNDKLRLAAKGALGAVPMEDPETRFHFVNPEMDTNVPHNPKGPKNNYQDILQESLDFNRPLHLRPKRTNFYGKSDPSAPHPTTQNFELMDAAAPVSGHAITVEDIERMSTGRKREQDLQAELYANEEETNAVNNREDGMEEFVLGCNDAEEDTTMNTKTLLFAPRDAAPLKKKKLKAALPPEATPRRIGSMTDSAKRDGRLVQVSGTKKAKRLSTAPPTRLVKSGTKAAKKRASANK